MRQLHPPLQLCQLLPVGWAPRLVPLRVPRPAVRWPAPDRAAGRGIQRFTLGIARPRNRVAARAASKGAHGDHVFERVGYEYQCGHQPPFYLRLHHRADRHGDRRDVGVDDDPAIGLPSNADGDGK